jgi:hypothetical protein
MALALLRLHDEHAIYKVHRLASCHHYAQLICCGWHISTSTLSMRKCREGIKVAHGPARKTLHTFIECHDGIFVSGDMMAAGYKQWIFERVITSTLLTSSDE